MLRKFSLLGVFVLALAASHYLPVPLYAQGKLDTDNGKIVRETWDSVYLRPTVGLPVKIGYVRTTFTEVALPAANAPVPGVSGVMELRLELKREGQTVEIRADVGTVEAATGKVVAVTRKLWLGKSQSQSMQGILDADGKTMKLKVVGDAELEKKIDWDAQSLGLARQDSLWRDRQVKPGDTFRYLYYEATLASQVWVKVNVLGEAAFTLPGQPTRKLLKVDAIPEKISGVQLPSQTLWLEPKTLEVVASESEFPGLGPMVMLRGPKATALGENGKVPDVFADQSIKLDKPILDAHKASEITYRIRFNKPSDDLVTLIASDARQTVKKVDANTLEVTIRAVRKPASSGDPKDASAADLESNYYLNSDDDEVRKLAKRAVVDATNPFDKARKIERWVRENMKAVDYGESMASSDHVARTLSGDCSEFSMLCAGMCKSMGIPSRTAIGLIYVEHRKIGPIFAFHMWTEVFVRDQWISLDATRGFGFVGPAHIKIASSNWHDERSFKPLLPVTGFMLAKPSVAVTKVVAGE